MSVRDDLPAPRIGDDVALELGRYFAVFNWIEGILANLLSECVDARGAPIDPLLAQMMFRGTLDATKNILAFVRTGMNRGLRERITSVLTKLAAVAEMRNDFAHSEWRLVEGLGLHSMAKRTRKGTGKFRAQTAESVGEAREELEQLGAELASLTDEYVTTREQARNETDAPT